MKCRKRKSREFEHPCSPRASYGVTQLDELRYISIRANFARFSRRVSSPVPPSRIPRAWKVTTGAIIGHHRDCPRGNGSVGSGARNLVFNCRYGIRSRNFLTPFCIARARTILESRCTGTLSVEACSFALSVESERGRENVRVHRAVPWTCSAWTKANENLSRPH